MLPSHYSLAMDKSLYPVLYSGSDPERSSDTHYSVIPFWGEQDCPHYPLIEQSRNPKKRMVCHTILMLTTGVGSDPAS